MRYCDVMSCIFQIGMRQIFMIFLFAMRLISISIFRIALSHNYLQSSFASGKSLIILNFLSMILEPAYQKIEQQPTFLDPKPLSECNAPQTVPDQPIQNVEPIKYLMDFVPPPINDSTKYHDQLQNDFLQTLSKNPVGVDYLSLFGEKRPLDISHTKLPEPLFVDASTKVKMKKMVRSVYQKIIETLKYCAGQLPMSQGSPLSKIQEKSHQFMLLCQQVQVAQTQQTIWKIMQEETQQMNEKADQIEEFLKGMAEHCNNEKGKQGYP